MAVHAAFVRRVSRAMFADGDVADDVEQATWLAWLQRPESQGPPPRAWFRRVAANAGRKLARERTNRRAREESVARPESLPSAGELASDRELIRRVVDAVLGLPEPYRSAIVMRFYRDLSAAEIALRSGEPEATVRSRIRRGLAKLEAALDRSPDPGSSDPGSSDPGSSEPGASDWRTGLAALAGIRAAGDAMPPAAAVGARRAAKIGLAAVWVGWAILGAGMGYGVGSCTRDDGWWLRADRGAFDPASGSASVASRIDARSSVADRARPAGSFDAVLPSSPAEADGDDEPRETGAVDVADSEPERNAGDEPPAESIRIWLRDVLSDATLAGTEIRYVVPDRAFEHVGVADGDGIVEVPGDAIDEGAFMELKLPARLGGGRHFLSARDRDCSKGRDYVFRLPVYARIVLPMDRYGCERVGGCPGCSWREVHARVVAVPDPGEIPTHVRAIVGDSQWTLAGGEVVSLRQIENMWRFMPDFYRSKLRSLIERVGPAEASSLASIAQALEVDAAVVAQPGRAAELFVPYDGEVFVYAMAEDFRAESRLLDVEPGEEYEVRLDLHREPRVSGTLVDEFGRPIPCTRMGVWAVTEYDLAETAPIAKSASGPLYNASFTTAHDGDQVFDSLMLSEVFWSDPSGRFEVFLPFTGDVCVYASIDGVGSWCHRLQSEGRFDDVLGLVLETTAPGDPHTMLVVDEHGDPVPFAMFHPRLVTIPLFRFPALIADERGVVDVMCLDEGLEYNALREDSSRVWTRTENVFRCEAGGTIVLRGEGFSALPE